MAPKERIPKQNQLQIAKQGQTLRNTEFLIFILNIVKKNQKDRTSIKLFPHKFVQLTQLSATQRSRHLSYHDFYLTGGFERRENPWENPLRNIMKYM